MVDRIKSIGEKAGVNVFNRFALMKRWVDDGIPIFDLDDGENAHLHTGGMGDELPRTCAR